MIHYLRRPKVSYLAMRLSVVMPIAIVGLAQPPVVGSHVGVGPKQVPIRTRLAGSERALPKALFTAPSDRNGTDRRQDDRTDLENWLRSRQLDSEPMPELRGDVASDDESEQDTIHAAALYLEARLLRRTGDHMAALRKLQRAWRYYRLPRSSLSEPEPPTPTIDEEIGVASSLDEELLELAYQLDLDAEIIRYGRLIDPATIREEALLIEVAGLLTEDESYSAAVEYYARWLEVAESDATLSMILLVRLEMGRLQYLTEDYDATADHYRIVMRAVEEAEGSDRGGATIRSFLGAAHETFAVMGEGFLAAGDVDAAENAFRRSNEAREDPLLWSYRQARIHDARQQHEEALDQMHRLFENPEFETSTEALGILKRAIRSTENSSEDDFHDRWLIELQSLHHRRPGDHILTIELARQLFERDDIEQAVRTLESVWQLAPSNSIADLLVDWYIADERLDDLIVMLGEIAAAAGDLDRIDPDRDRWSDSPPETFWEDAFAEDSRFMQLEDFGQLSALAMIASRLNRLEAAERFYRRSVDFRGNRELSDIERSWCMELLAAEHYEQVIDTLHGRMERDPSQELETRFLLSGALSMLDQHDEAIEHANFVAQTIPGSIVVQSRVAWILQRAGRHEESRQLYLVNIKLFDRDLDDAELREQIRQTKMILSGIELEADKTESSVEWLEQVLDEFPDDRGALNDLGYLWVDRKQHLSRGLAMTRRAVELEPSNAAFLDSLGWALYRNNQFDEAITVLQQATELKPQDPDLLDHLGDAYFQSGELDSAIHSWTRSAALYEEAGDIARQQIVESKISNNESD